MGCAGMKSILPDKSATKRIVRPETGFDYPTTKAGNTAGGVTVYYDPSLGPQGLSVAQLLLSQADGLMTQMSVAFGTPISPLNVIIAGLSGNNDGTGGAYHYGCDFQTGADIYVDACFNEPVFDAFLFVAEASE